MRLSALRDFALSLPETISIKQWGEHLVFKVSGKVFCVIGVDGDTVDGVTFKCRPADFDDLLEIESASQAPYFAKRHWVRIADATALPLPKLRELIRQSYDLVMANLPKKVQAKLKAELE